MVTDAQVRRLMSLIPKEKTLAVAAAKTGMDEKPEPVPGPRASADPCESPCAASPCRDYQVLRPPPTAAAGVGASVKGGGIGRPAITRPKLI